MLHKSGGKRCSGLKMSEKEVSLLFNFKGTLISDIVTYNEKRSEQGHFICFPMALIQRKCTGIVDNPHVKRGKRKLINVKPQRIVFETNSSTNKNGDEVSRQNKFLPNPNPKP